VAAQKFTRKELKQDPFVEKTQKSLEFIQQNATAVGAVLLVLVVVLVGASYVRKGQDSANIEASFLLYHGQTLLSQGAHELAMAPLQECIDKRGKTEYAKYARVSLVQAMLAAGQTDDALLRAELYRAELNPRHPARADLDKLYVHALADAGRYETAAATLGEMPSGGLTDIMIYDRYLQRSRWLQAAGDHAGAYQILNELRQAIISGELKLPASDIDQRLEVARALQR
jgi:predicted negative regulator of RcsB-dependent stress response